MTVVLINPPAAKACEPLLGIATLKAYLAAHGVGCECIDANAEAQEWLLDRERIDLAVDRLARTPGARAPRLEKLLRTWPTIRTQLDRIKASLRSWEAYEDFDRYRTAVTSLNRAFGLASAAHDAAEGSPVAATLTDYLDDRTCDMDSASVVEAARRPEANLFTGYFREDLLPRLRALNPSVVGLSLIFRNQLVCGAVLARLIKEALPHVHVVLGGELVSAWAEHLEHTHLPELADSILPYEGELGLLALARALGPGGDGRLERVPNLCWRDASGAFHRNPTSKLATLAEAPAPDFSWAPWHLYFAPERTAPMVTARGCYWNRCTFCPEVVNPETRLRYAAVERLCHDLDTVHERDGVTWFHFIDSAMPPRTLKGVARHVIAGRRPYRWYGFSRLEAPLLSEGAAAELALGGCRLLMLGLETASQRLLDGMDKKQDVGDVSRILRALHDARILVHAFLMFGTPREDRADAELTRQFISDHAECVQFMNCSLMNLARGSPMALDPPAHGIRAVRPFEIPGRRLDLALYDNFVGEGWGRLPARRFLHDAFLRDPRIRPSYLRTPACFDSNHSVFFHGRVF